MFKTPQLWSSVSGDWKSWWRLGSFLGTGWGTLISGRGFIWTAIQLHWKGPRWCSSEIWSSLWSHSKHIHLAENSRQAQNILEKLLYISCLAWEHFKVPPEKSCRIWLERKMPCHHCPDLDKQGIKDGCTRLQRCTKGDLTYGEVFLSSKS